VRRLPSLPVAVQRGADGPRVALRRSRSATLGSAECESASAAPRARLHPMGPLARIALALSLTVSDRLIVPSSRASARIGHIRMRRDDETITQREKRKALVRISAGEGDSAGARGARPMTVSDRPLVPSSPSPRASARKGDTGDEGTKGQDARDNHRTARPGARKATTAAPPPGPRRERSAARIACFHPARSPRYSASPNAPCATNGGNGDSPPTAWSPCVIVPKFHSHARLHVPGGDGTLELSRNAK
jgi:hypothetical protein